MYQNKRVAKVLLSNLYTAVIKSLFAYLSSVFLQHLIISFVFLFLFPTSFWRFFFEKCKINPYLSSVSLQHLIVEVTFCRWQISSPFEFSGQLDIHGRMLVNWELYTWRSPILWELCRGIPSNRGRWNWQSRSKGWRSGDWQTATRSEPDWWQR